MSAPLFDLSLRVPLDRFDLVVEHQSDERVLGVFGPSGSGKTTLLETIAGLRRQATGLLGCAGQTWLDSKSGHRLPAHARGIGYVPQDHLLFPHRDVRQNLRAGRHRAQRQMADPEERFREVVEILELAPLLDRRVDTLSGGERQRVALGRALCSGPRLLLLDEPLASLDPTLRHRILPFLRRVRDTFALPILIVSHNPVELLALCDEVIALREGQVVAAGPPAELFARPEIYPAAAQEGFVNVLPARVQGTREHSAQLRLGTTGDGPALTVQRPDLRIGDPVHLGLPAHDILVATVRPSAISARNLLNARIVGLEIAGHRVLLTARLEDAPALPALIVEITRDAVDELHLEAGAPVCLAIKSSSIVVYS